MNIQTKGVIYNLRKFRTWKKKLEETNRHHYATYRYLIQKPSRINLFISRPLRRTIR